MRNNARRIWSSTPQNCATTNRVTFDKRTYLQEVYLESDDLSDVCVSPIR